MSVSGKTSNAQRLTSNAEWLGATAERAAEIKKTDGSAIRLYQRVRFAAT
jgi:hypothetical protein